MTSLREVADRVVDALVADDEPAQETAQRELLGLLGLSVDGQDLLDPDPAYAIIAACTDGYQKGFADCLEGQMELIEEQSRIVAERAAHYTQRRMVAMLYFKGGIEARLGLDAAAMYWYRAAHALWQLIDPQAAGR